jgi:hypothetical protein
MLSVVQQMLRNMFRTQIPTNITPESGVPMGHFQLHSRASSNYSQQVSPRLGFPTQSDRPSFHVSAVLLQLSGPRLGMSIIVGIVIEKTSALALSNHTKPVMMAALQNLARQKR